MKVEHATWPQATMIWLGLLLALGGIWGLHEQGGRASSAATRVWTQTQPLTHLQAVALGILSWCAAVLVVSTCFLGLMLLAVWVQRRVHSPPLRNGDGACLDAVDREDTSGIETPGGRLYPILMKKTRNIVMRSNVLLRSPGSWSWRRLPLAATEGGVEQTSAHMGRKLTKTVYIQRCIPRAARTGRTAVLRPTWASKLVEPYTADYIFYKATWRK